MRSKCVMARISAVNLKSRTGEAMEWLKRRAPKSEQSLNQNPLNLTGCAVWLASVTGRQKALLRLLLLSVWLMGLTGDYKIGWSEGLHAI